MDRLGRSLHHLITILQELEHRGIGFKSLTESINTTTATGKLHYHLMGALGEFERSLIQERTKAGRQAVRARGITTTNGKHWRSNSLRQVLANPNLATIIGMDQSDRLQRIFSDPARKRQGRPARHLLSGIVRCQCGARMYVTSRGDGKSRYRCFHNTAVSNCGKTQVAAHLLEGYVTKETIRWLSGPGLVVVRNRLMQLDRDLTLLAQKLHADERELEELARLKGEGRYTIAEWLALRDPIEARIKVARDLLDKEPAVLALTNIPETRKELEAAWETWDIDRKRSVLKAAIAELKVTPTATRGPGPFDQDRVKLLFVSDHPGFDRVWRRSRTTLVCSTRSPGRWIKRRKRRCTGQGPVSLFHCSGMPGIGPILNCPSTCPDTLITAQQFPWGRRSAMQSDGLLTIQDVSRMLRVPVKTLRRWRLNRVGLWTRSVATIDESELYRSTTRPMKGRAMIRRLSLATTVLVLFPVFAFHASVLEYE